MKLFILGATGAIGQHLVKFALEREHEVTAYVRSPRKIGGRHERLKVVEGDVFDVGELARSLAGNDAVLSSFGPLTMRATTLRRDFGRTLAAAMRESEVRRVQIVSAAFLFRDIGLLGGVLKATIFRQMIPDMAGMEAELCQSDLEWTMVRPPRLTKGPASHLFRIADGKLPSGGTLISRADVACFMIGEAENPKHARLIVGLAN
jgi:putative NADH-flavin reductase